MVSTRGVRYKFSEGERVLCYEPDPTKAKVLYDSKVLEVIESKDKRGRRTVEYLIHFQGWNSSWDRCVSEDFVLKDTEENRQLQRDLAEKSQLQLGAYLYRRERKKGASTSSSGVQAKRGRLGFSDDGSSSSTQPDEGETVDTDSSSGSGSGSAPRSPPPAHCGRAHIALPCALRDRLTFDYHLVVKRGRLSQLPASPNAAQILESFVKWFARAGAWNPARPKHEPHAHHKPDMQDVSCRLNLVREVADGLRVYFDFLLRGHLLYKQEHSQYDDMCGMYFNENEGDIKIVPDDEGNQSQDDAAVESLEEDLKSPKIPEYSHLPPDPVQREVVIQQEDVPDLILIEPTQNKQEIHEETGKHIENDSEKRVECEVIIEPVEDFPSQGGKHDITEFTIEVKVEVKSEPESPPDGSPPEPLEPLEPPEPMYEIEIEKPKEVPLATRSASVARRLRSHKSCVSQSEGEDAAPEPRAPEPRAPEPHSSSAGSSGGSSVGEAWPAPRPPAPAPAPGRTPLSLLLDKVSKWQIIPREESTEQLPCRIYGAIHLARLFVKLPDFLNAAQMPDFKLKLVLKYIDMFVQYLDEHSEWFGEMYYIADNVSRSH
ncbi:MSL complex subunit 3 isoform X2 [Epargyreus clarus]|uniref:MSL complex subunit 3 isoform X2 n=1 Tax=Epargyreus clarus TaxID=520877 RepID=UPI003C2FB5E0